MLSTYLSSSFPQPSKDFVTSSPNKSVSSHERRVDDALVMTRSRRPELEREDSDNHFNISQVLLFVTNHRLVIYKMWRYMLKKVWF